MAEFPALPLWTDAYLGDTTHLTTLEHGAYLLLLMTMWRSKTTSLPNDDKMLARYTKLSPSQWKRIKAVILEFFDIENDRLIQRRLIDEINLVKQKSKRASENSRARWLKNNETTQADAMQSQSKRNATTPLPLSTSSKEEDTKVSPKKVSEEKSINKAFDLFKAFAQENGLSVPAKLTSPRKSRLKARLSDCGGVEGWVIALDKVKASSFCMGLKTDFKANLDFMLQESSFTKLMEGAYDDNDNKPPSQGNRMVEALQARKLKRKNWG